MKIKKSRSNGKTINRHRFTAEFHLITLFFMNPLIWALIARSISTFSGFRRCKRNWISKAYHEFVQFVTYEPKKKWLKWILQPKFTRCGHKFKWRNETFMINSIHIVNDSCNGITCRSFLWLIPKSTNNYLNGMFWWHNSFYDRLDQSIKRINNFIIETNTATTHVNVFVYDLH